MTIIINGQAKDSSADTLTALLLSLGMKADRVAVELNREIVPRHQWEKTKLADGDRVEIVQFVGGGAPSVPVHPRSRWSAELPR